MKFQLVNSDKLILTRAVKTPERNKSENFSHSAMGDPKNKIPSPIKYIFPKPNYGRSHLVGTLFLGILLLVSANTFANLRERVS